MKDVKYIAGMKAFDFYQEMEKVKRRIWKQVPLFYILRIRRKLLQIMPIGTNFGKKGIFELVDVQMYSRYVGCDVREQWGRFNFWEVVVLDTATGEKITGGLSFAFSREEIEEVFAEFRDKHRVIHSYLFIG